jgi:L-asparaginase type II
MLEHMAKACALPLAISALLSVSPISPALAQDDDLPLIKIVATGGTIANTPDGRLSVDAVIEALPEVEAIAGLRTEEVTRVGSSTLSWQDFIDTAKTIERSLEEEPDIDGFVVTIGSNTSEDMAYFLNLVLDTDKPVVVTAAQRQRTTMSEDASRNFIDAVITAGTPEASGKGVLLVANELIHSGRDVVKHVISRVDSWQSFDLGALGMISGGEAKFYRAPTRRHTVDSEFSLDGIETADQLPQVEIIYSYVDASPALIDAAVADGADGLVVAAFATGSAHRGQRPHLEQAMENGVTVVIGNRGSAGGYEVADSGSYYDLQGDTLAPQKALILLKMALTMTDDPAELQRIFSEY